MGGPLDTQYLFTDFMNQVKESVLKRRVVVQRSVDAVDHLYL
jgi:predicted TIM-barrel fold metal-dependent hydrolase